MSVEVANSYTRMSASPVFWDVTTLGTAWQTQSDLSWWRRLGGDATDIVSVVLSTLSWPKEEAPHSHGFVEGTLPSESGVITVLDATEDRGDELDVLLVATELGDEAAFLQAANRIDWSRRPASDLDRGIRLALAAGAHLFARSLAAQGAKLYPRHPELQKMARILAPPRVVQRRLPPDLSVRANQAWFVKHADKYAGQWVALEQGNLVAAATTVAKLRSQLNGLAGVLITKVS